jgi:pimeloyl-ACP methyl ester carboxylesterase
MIYGGSVPPRPDTGREHAAKVLGGQARLLLATVRRPGLDQHPLAAQDPSADLVLAGDDDPLIPLINMRLLAWRIPNAHLHIIDDGHLFLITRAEAVAPIIMNFSKKNDNAP